MKIVYTVILGFLLAACSPNTADLSRKIGHDTSPDGPGAIALVSPTAGMSGDIEENRAVQDELVTRASERVLEAVRTVCQTKVDRTGPNKKGCSFQVFIVDDRRGGAAYRANKIRLSRAFLNRLQGEAEVAFIIAHEAAHGILSHRHNVNSLARRRQELEADVLGRELIGLAGYPTGVAERFFERLAQRSNSATSADPNYPTYAQRATELRKSPPQDVKRNR